MSASAPQPAHEPAKQYADSHFVHSSMDFCGKICSSKRLLVRFEDNAIYGKIVL